MNDADIETAQIQDRANRADQLATQGICTHGWLQTLPNGTCECKECGKLFDNSDAAMDEHDRLVNS
jgi:hypothetical protein